MCPACQITIDSARFGCGASIPAPDRRTQAGRPNMHLGLTGRREGRSILVSNLPTGRVWRHALCVLVFPFLGYGLSDPVTASAVGWTEGEFSVDATGTANYRIPITVAPGVAGMEPDLALLYSSRAGNGHVGLGWSLSGLSAISRCGATRATEGYQDGVDLTSNDRLCLDGQKLVRLGSPPNSTAHADYWAAGSEYRTEVESFQQVLASSEVAASTPRSFTVRDRAGLIRHYGSTEDSRIQVTGGQDPGLGRQPYRGQVRKLHPLRV